MAKVKTIYWISGIIGVTFILFLIVLRATDNIKLGWLLILSIITLVFVVAIDMFASFRKPKLSISGIPDIINKEPIPLEEMDNLANKKLLFSYADYPEEVYWDGEVLGMGKTATPTYFKMCRGRYSRKIYGLVYNMIDTSRGGIVEYDDTKQSLMEIKSNMMLRGNRAALSPRLELPTRKTRTHNVLTGTTTEEEDPVIESQIAEKNQEGELK